MRNIIRKILKEETKIVIPNNKKKYIDKVLKRWETDIMNTHKFIDVYSVDTDMALYIRQKIVEELKNVPIGKKIWVLDKDFPSTYGFGIQNRDINFGTYDFKFTINNIIDYIDSGTGVSSTDPEYLSYRIGQGLVKDILLDEIEIDTRLHTEGSVDINVQYYQDGEYELKEFSIYDALKDDDFGWEVEGEIKDIIWEYVMSFSPLLYRIRPEISINLHFMDRSYKEKI